MTDFYELTTPGPPPIKTSEAKSYLKLTTRADDPNVALMTRAALRHGEMQTGRDFRANSWTLLRDGFDQRICLTRSPVDEITSVERLVSASFSAVASSVYYLKPGAHFSEILLEDGESWPTDMDTKEHDVRIVFVTKALEQIDVAKLAMLKHISYMHENRGDCDVNNPTAIAEAARACGADSLYYQFKIPNI